ncbi:MAG: hypothetical protein R3293_14010 [Candidatus Promineifilaceae bacterium]|nr:hypothetical protein [Candidatus Promineifilaceae bacterium]
MSKELQLDETHQERTLNKTVSDVLKAGVVGMLAVVMTVIPFEQFVFQFAGVSYAEFRGGMPALYLFPLFLIYAAIALVIAKMKKNLYISKRGAFLIIFAFHYFIVSFLPDLEGKIYLPDFTFFSAITSGFILALAVVSLIFYLWKQEEHPEAKTGQQVRSYFSSRSILSWAWRFFLVWIMFYAVTMIIGIVAMPFNGAYLEDPLNTLGMVVPSMGALFAITQFRSLVYLLVTLPFIIFWNSSKKNLFLYLALILIIQYPLLGDGLAYFWPGMYRLTDGIVLALQVCIMSWLYVTLLWKGKGSGNGNAVEKKDKSAV